MNKIIKIIYVFLIFLLFEIRNIVAQPSFDDGVNDVPVDSWVGFLLALGFLYGIKKLVERK